MATTNADSEKFVFEHGATKYSDINAYALARMAEWAYRTAAEIKKLTTDLGFDANEFLFFDGKKTQTQGFAVADKVKVIFAFRGTETKPPGVAFTDALTDAKFKFTSGPFGAKIHEGFSEGLNEVWPDVLDAIKDLNPKGGKRTVWFTGHSLGAALATLTAARMTEMNRRLDGMYVYGSPRCGDADFVKGFNASCKNFQRLVNERDLVTRVVPRLLGYRHVGELAQLSKDGIEHRGFTETSFLQEALIALNALRTTDFSSLGDHKMVTGYLPKLKKIATQGK